MRARVRVAFSFVVGKRATACVCTALLARTTEKVLFGLSLSCSRFFSKEMLHRELEEEREEDFFDVGDFSLLCPAPSSSRFLLLLCFLFLAVLPSSLHLLAPAADLAEGVRFGASPPPAAPFACNDGAACALEPAPGPSGTRGVTRVRDRERKRPPPPCPVQKSTTPTAACVCLHARASRARTSAAAHFNLAGRDIRDGDLVVGHRSLHRALAAGHGRSEAGPLLHFHGKTKLILTPSL